MREMALMRHHGEVRVDGVDGGRLRTLRGAPAAITRER